MLSIHLSTWPSFDPALLEVTEIEVPVQVRGKVRARLLMPKDATAAALEAAALQHEKVIEALAGEIPKKIIVVPGKMVNIVV